MNKEKIILISNDDGIFSPGLNALKNSLKDLGRVITVAPEKEMSAVSRAITIQKNLAIKEIKNDVWQISGTPTDCIYIAIHYILKNRPDIIVSGINKGPNLGHDVYYSGTVACAFEACHHNIPSFAISVNSKQDPNFNKAAKFARIIAAKILKNNLPQDILLNINVPNTSNNNFAYKITTLGQRVYANIMKEVEDSWGKKYIKISEDKINYIITPNSDCEAIHNNFISITPLSIIPNHVNIDEIKKILE